MLRRALGTLEQDARQIAEASSEGMGGERNKLHDVLVAKEMLALPPVAAAYNTVLLDLRSREERDPAIGTHAQLRQAIATLETVIASFEGPSVPAADATAKPGGGTGIPET